MVIHARTRSKVQDPWSLILEPWRNVNLIDLVKRCRKIPYFNEYLVAKFGFDTAENQSSKVCQKVIRKLENWVRINIWKRWNRFKLETMEGQLEAFPHPSSVYRLDKSEVFGQLHSWLQHPCAARLLFNLTMFPCISMLNLSIHFFFRLARTDTGSWLRVSVEIAQWTVSTVSRRHRVSRISKLAAKRRRRIVYMHAAE